MKDEVKTKLMKARVRLLEEKCPYWGILCMNLDFVENPNIPTMATDGKVVFYNPKFVMSLTMPELMFVEAHETGGHVGLLHPIRFRELMTKVKDFDWDTANEAADHIVNLMLMHEGIGQAPQGALYDRRFKGKSFEEIYRILKSEKQAKQQQQQQQQQGQGQGQGQNQPQQGTQGQPGSDPGRCGGVLPSPEPQADLKEVEEQAKEMVRGALQASKKAGYIPEGLRDMLEGILEPKSNWRGSLREYAEERSRREAVWSKPNRRYVPYNLFLPTMGGRQLGEVVAMIDRSGSITEEEGRVLLGECLQILEEYPGSRLWTIPFATRASQPYELTCPEDIQNIKQTDVGYGTDYRPPFKVLDEQGLDPAVTIVLTDGECWDFPKNWDGPVLWVINNKNKFNPPFGEVIRMVD